MGAWKSLLAPSDGPGWAPRPMEAPPEQMHLKKSQKSPCFLHLLHSGGQERGEVEVRGCRSLVKVKCPRTSGVHILAGLMREEESGPEIKQGFGNTNSTNSHGSAAGEKFQRLLDPGKGPSSSPTNSTTPHGTRTSGSFLLLAFYERGRKTFLAALGE